MISPDSRTLFSHFSDFPYLASLAPIAAPSLWDGTNGALRHKNGTAAIHSETLHKASFDAVGGLIGDSAHCFFRGIDNES